jgi:hypothetical protein
MSYDIISLDIAKVAAANCRKIKSWLVCLVREILPSMVASLCSINSKHYSDQEKVNISDVFLGQKYLYVFSGTSFPHM